MTKYHTNNPLGSTDPRDLYDNAQNLDVAVNDTENDTWKDRFGRERVTLKGYDSAFQDFLINSGYENIGDYGPGLEITARNQIFWRDGELYRAGAALELPYTTTGDWGAEESLFVVVGDQALRQELADPSGDFPGAAIVGYKGASVASALEDAEDQLSEIDLRLTGRGISSGFDGTGTVDISSRMQYILDSEGVVILPAGNFKLSATVSLPSGAVVRGQGIGKTRIFRDTSVAPFDMFEGVSIDGAHFSGIFFDGVEKLGVTFPENRYCAIRMWDGDTGIRSQRLTVRDCRFDKFTSAEHQPEGNRGVISVDGCDDVQISGCRFYDNRATCIFYSATSNILVNANYCLGEQLPYDPVYQPDQGLGSFCSGGADGQTISGNRIESTGYTSLNVGGRGITISGNTILDSNYSGVMVDEGGGNPSLAIAITGNSIHNTSLPGIFLSNILNFVVSGNTVTNCGTRGSAGGIRVETFFDGSSTGGVISGNNIYGNTGPGIRMHGGIRIVIQSNYLGHNAGSGISFIGSKNTQCHVVGNSFVNNSVYAMDTSSTALEGMVVNVSGNTVIADSFPAQQNTGFVMNGAQAFWRLGSNTFSANYDTSIVETSFGNRAGKAFLRLNGATVTAMKTVSGLPGA